MNSAATISFAGAILWAESAMHVFDTCGDACPPNLLFARLNTKFSLEELRRAHAELDELDRSAVDSYLSALRTSQVRAAQRTATVLQFPTPAQVSK